MSVPYIYRLGDAVSSAVSAIPTEASSSVSSAIATASAGTAAWLKKFALRAAGREGLAENVPNEHGRPFGFDAVHIAQDLVSREETRFRDELQWVHCLDTSGQVFAILLNVVYLLPLTWLFAQFFITAYLKRVERRRSSTASEKVTVARQSLRDASRGVARRLSEVVEEMHRTSADIGDDEVLVDADEVRQELKYAASQAKAQILKGTEKIKQSAASVDADKIKQEVQRDLQTAKQNLNKAADKARATAVETGDKLKQQRISEKAEAVKDSLAKAIDQASTTIKTESQKAAQDLKPIADEVVDRTQQTAAKIKDQVAGASNEETKDTVTSSGGTPNGNGTGAEEATGQSSPEKQSSKKKNKKNKKGGVNGEQQSQAKKQEDQIIDQSQLVRDEDVDKAIPDESSQVQEGKSFADAAKE